MTPIYDIRKTYLENATQGPFFTGEIPKFDPLANPIDFLGYKLNSPLGVPAGPLLNSKWISLAAELGFDLPTYKTIRSFPYPGHSLPNIVFIEKISKEKARQIDCSVDAATVSITNSFGMPSMSPEFLMQDIEKANASLKNGQVMIVSIVGSQNRGISFLDDFIRSAQLARAAGAKIIEANFSCPNVDKEEGSLYTSSETVYEYVKKIATAIRPIPLLIKVGTFSTREQMRNVFIAAAKAGCSGICGINSVSMEVVDAKGNPALGPSRGTSGVCGSAIRDDAIRFMKEATTIKRAEKLDLALLGCGGIMSPEHFTSMLDAGAQIAMSATGMMWDPLLAIRYRKSLYANAHP